MKYLLLALSLSLPLSSYSACSSSKPSDELLTKDEITELRGIKKRIVKISQKIEQLTDKMIVRDLSPLSANGPALKNFKKILKATHKDIKTDQSITLEASLVKNFSTILELEQKDAKTRLRILTGREEGGCKIFNDVLDV